MRLRTGGWIFGKFNGVLEIVRVTLKLWEVSLEFVKSLAELGWFKEFVESSGKGIRINCNNRYWRILLGLLEGEGILEAEDPKDQAKKYVTEMW